MQAVLISIRPKWCAKIANGEKTIEVRKAYPNISAPFKCYIYCTQKPDMLWILKPELRKQSSPALMLHAKNVFGAYRGNGCVIGEFVCKNVDVYPFEYCSHPEIEGISDYADSWYGIYDEDLRRACLKEIDLRMYGNGRDLYGWNISDLKIYDKPLPLNAFKKWNRDCAYSDLGLAIPECEKCTDAGCFVQKPPQSWFFVEELP